MTESDPAPTSFDALAADIQDLKSCLLELREVFDDRDYAPTLGAMAAVLQSLEALPALRDTPEDYERRRARSLDEARRTFNAEIAQARSAIRADAEEIHAIIGQLRDRRSQTHMIIAAGIIGLMIGLAVFRGNAAHARPLPIAISQSLYGGPREQVGPY